MAKRFDCRLLVYLVLRSMTIPICRNPWIKYRFQYVSPRSNLHGGQLQQPPAWQWRSLAERPNDQSRIQSPAHRVGSRWCRQANKTCREGLLRSVKASVRGHRFSCSWNHVPCNCHITPRLWRAVNHTRFQLASDALQFPTRLHCHVYFTTIFAIALFYCISHCMNTVWRMSRNSQY